MGLFNFFRKTSVSARDAELTAFYATQPGWESYRSNEQILGFLQTHPHWNLVDEPVLIELTRRITTPQFESIAYNYAAGFNVLVTICEKYRVIETNFLKICREPEGPEFGTPAAKLWMFAWTLERLANRFLSEAEVMSPKRDLQTLGERFADVRSAAEACLTVDPYFYTAYKLLPIAWMGDAYSATVAYGASEHEVQRTRPELSGEAFREAVLARFHQWVATIDQRAFAICDEGVRLCEYLQKNASSLPSFHDQKMAEEASRGIGEIEAVRKRLAIMQG